MGIPDPAKFVEEIIVLVGVVVASYLTWRFRKRVLVICTGDDRIHGTCLDFVWFTIFQCCGICDGNWTRCLTRCCCCPPRFRGANLVKVFGQVLGFTTYTVELKNIVVGDLPWERRADFYLCVECAANPPMMTSLAEGKHPKVVHFPEVITLRIRWSHMEEQVRITVRELNLLGHNDLCRAKISAMNILDWTYDPHERTKRFEMKTLDQTMERETPPWILVEFDQPTEGRDLEHFHGNVNTVRMTTSDGTYRDNPMNIIKHQYALLDNTGHPLQEPLEEELQELAWTRWCASCSYGMVHLGTLVVIFAYICFRLYVFSCYHAYVHLTMAYMNNATFPISSTRLWALVRNCHDLLDGTGARPGVSCKPNSTEVMSLCLSHEDGGMFPEAQPRPTAFAPGEWFGIDIRGVPCFDGICILRNQLKPYDLFLTGCCILLLVFNCLLRHSLNNYIHKRKTTMMRQRADDTRSMQAEYRTRRQGKAR